MIRIIDSLKEKCEELRQQHHVLQERVIYLDDLQSRLDVAVAAAGNAAAAADDAGQGDARRDPVGGEKQHQDNEQMAAAGVVAVINRTASKICAQLNQLNAVRDSISRPLLS